MSTTTAKFKSAGRAALLALVLGSSTVMATMPAQAQAEPRFNFQLGVGPSGPNSFSFGFGNDQRRPGGPNWDRPGRWCMNDREVRRAVQDYGFRDVEVRRELGRDRVEVVARWHRGGGWYSMRVNRCTGEVDRVERLRRGGGGRGPGGPGFGLQFNF
ncbi:hypothetical protein SAMN02983003_1209 [Devosia enhydra]|uniref:Peptidase propeptide and YPEB domain-containing protein n=1 Tax=Devosia enhydra TaxID=665118 RepID=A0A1K2HVC8_9HYPH|nr:hypothetical protein [Devosia enhydra]SFZ82668.1 hypothetical protein SAMN02983003_1209 [Devosia enhydra]